MALSDEKLAAIRDEWDAAFAKGLGNATREDAFRLANYIPALLREIDEMSRAYETCLDVTSHAMTEIQRLREELARARAVPVPDRYTIVNRPGSTEFLFGEREPEEPHR